MPKTYQSQLGEDRRLEELLTPWLPLLRGKGTFVEAGAMDGVKYSNTYLFATQYGWRGYLFEPVKHMFDSLIINRPESECHNCCLGNESSMVEIIGNNEVAGIKSAMSPGFIEKWHTCSQSTIVEQRRMSDFISHPNARNIDLLSLDCEGGELEVLEGMDPLVKYHFILIEAVERWNRARNESCRELLRSRGYTFLERFKINEIWQLKSYSDSFYGDLLQ